MYSIMMDIMRFTMASFLAVHCLEEGKEVMVEVTLSKFELVMNILRYVIIYISMTDCRESRFILLGPLATFRIISREVRVYSMVHCITLPPSPSCIL